MSELKLRNVTVLPGHDDEFIAVWQRDARDQSTNGAELLDAYIETGTGTIYNLNEKRAGDTGERRIHTSLWRVADVGEATSLASLSDDLSRHAGHVEVTTVAAEWPVAEVSALTKMTIMRRYQIQGDWDEFMAVWREVASVRQKYSFSLLFAVADRVANVFTWAFSTDLDDFQVFMQEGQKEYYSDPQRTSLERINLYMREIALTPARRLTSDLTM